jgi:tRNA nucleotidyltransferase (CCA-adding enzyme)
MNVSNISENAKAICKRLQQAGYQSYIVGGCIRDLLLNLPPKDWDITTNAPPEKVMELFPKHYPTGLQHGTVTVAMGEGVENHFEVTTFRIEGKYLDGRRPEEVFFVNNIEEDLARRDLTINAIAYDPINDKLVDPFHGINDLNNGIIRAVGYPQQRFREDGLRIMRAARFAARFNYKLCPETKAAMAVCLDVLEKVSMERIRDELCKILMSNNPKIGINILVETGAINVVCPILSTNYLRHFLHNIDKCKSQLETRVACLYFNVQSALVEQELLRLKFSNKEIKTIMLNFKLLDVIMQHSPSVFEESKELYIKLVAIIKNESLDWETALKEFIILNEANYPEVAAMFNKYKDVPVPARTDLKINGNDLLSIGVPPGKEIGSLLDKSYQLIMFQPELNIKEKLLQYCQNEKRKFIGSKI